MSSLNFSDFPPADQCDPEDLDNLADLVVRDPRASYDLAGSRAHIEALCRWAVGLAQRFAEVTEERDDLKIRAQHDDAARTRLGDLASDLLDDVSRVTTDLESARKAIADREDEIGRINNVRQSEVNEATAQRERADEAEAAAEVFEVTARAALAILARDRGAQPVEPVKLEEVVRAVDGRLGRALMRVTAENARLSLQLERTALLLDEQRQTRELDDQLRSTCRTITGKDLGEVNIQLDEELAANPDVGPLHHARDQRPQEDTTP